MVDEVIEGTEDYAADDPRSALSAFYRAFNGRDLGLMERVWLPGDEPSMSNPLGGIARGWSEIRALYQRLFEGDARVQVQFHDYRISPVGDGFVAVERERGSFAKRDVRFDLAIRTSRLFRQTPEGWRQLHHHGSIDDAQLLSRYQQSVR